MEKQAAWSEQPRWKPRRGKRRINSFPATLAAFPAASGRARSRSQKQKTNPFPSIPHVVSSLHRPPWPK